MITYRQEKKAKRYLAEKSFRRRTKSGRKKLANCTSRDKTEERFFFWLRNIGHHLKHFRGEIQTPQKCKLILTIN